MEQSTIRNAESLARHSRKTAFSIIVYSLNLNILAYVMSIFTADELIVFKLRLSIYLVT